jgi:hypothetical protein
VGDADPAPVGREARPRVIADRQVERLDRAVARDPHGTGRRDRDAAALGEDERARGGDLEERREDRGAGARAVVGLEEVRREDDGRTGDREALEVEGRREERAVAREEEAIRRDEAPVGRLLDEDPRLAAAARDDADARVSVIALGEEDAAAVGEDAGQAVVVAGGRLREALRRGGGGAGGGRAGPPPPPPPLAGTSQMPSRKRPKRTAPSESKQAPKRSRLATTSGLLEGRPPSSSFAMRVTGPPESGTLRISPSARKPA